jgi:hypothetical protein
LCDDAEGLDAGREVGLSITENRFGYTSPVKKDEAPPAPIVEAETQKVEAPQAEVSKSVE